MSGHGDIDCLRIFRELRSKVDGVTYGTHMALATATALLFVSGGMSSLRRDNFSIACLLLSLLPRYPSGSTDNQYHLQAWRHFSVLATENRFLQTIDTDTGKNVSVQLAITDIQSEISYVMSPCLLPELDGIREIALSSTGDSTSNSTNQLSPRLGSPRTSTSAPVGNNSVLYYPSRLVIPAGARLVRVPTLFITKRAKNAGMVCFHDALRRSIPEYSLDYNASACLLGPLAASGMYADVRLEAIKSTF
jgi:hypothetical protein